MQTLRSLIARHVEATGSPRGRWILENFDELLPRFVKVFPHEYKRVLGVPRSSSVYVPGQLLPPPASEQEVPRG